jgi:hypothetical protein
MAPGASSAAASAFSETPRLDLRLGRYDPIRKTIYGQLAGDSKIVALPESLYEAIPRGEFAFRDLTVLSFNPAQIDRLIVDRPGRSVTLQAPGSGTRATSWRMVAPVDTPADETAVTTLLVALSSLRAESWESESIANPAAYGFDRPSLRIRWMPRSGGTSGTPDASLSQTLRIGRAKPKSRAFYANIEGQSTVFALGPAEVIALDAELRDRRVLRYEPDRVRRVLLEWPGRTIALEPLAAEATGGRRTWRAEGVYEPGGFDPTPIGELVDSLAKLQTNRYLQHEGPISPFFGFDPPRLTITLTLADDATPRVLRVGTPLTTAQSAATTGDGRNGAVFVLPTTETWDRLIREPGRPGGLPDDVFVPIPEPVAP